MTEPTSGFSSILNLIRFSGLHVPFLLCFSWAGFAASPVQEKTINSTEVMTHDVSNCFPQQVNEPNNINLEFDRAQVTIKLLAPLFYSMNFLEFRCGILSKKWNKC